MAEIVQKRLLKMIDYICTMRYPFENRIVERIAVLIQNIHYATAFHSLIRSEHWRLVRLWTSATLHFAAICCGVQPRLRPKSSRYLICFGLAGTFLL